MSPKLQPWVNWFALWCQDAKHGVGERGRNRTFNLLIKSQLLCQLSYAPLVMSTGVTAESLIFPAQWLPIS